MFANNQTVETIKRTVEKSLNDCNAIIRNEHFVYSSGKHGSTFIEKDKVFTNPIACDRIADMMASCFAHVGGFCPEVVVGMAEGTIALGEFTALHLDVFRDFPGVVQSVWTSKDKDGNFYLRETMQDTVRGKKVAIVEDVTTTGSSIQKVADLLRKYGCEVLGAGIMVNRGDVKARQIGIPKLFSLLDMNEKSYSEQKCPLCKKDVEINTKFGHGKEFLEKQKQS